MPFDLCNKYAITYGMVFAIARRAIIGQNLFCLYAKIKLDKICYGNYILIVVYTLCSTTRASQLVGVNKILTPHGQRVTKTYYQKKGFFIMAKAKAKNKNEFMAKTIARREKAKVKREEQAIVDTMPKVYGYVVLPKRSVDRTASLTLDGKTIPYIAGSTLQLSIDLQEVSIINKDLKGILAYAIDRPLPTGIRRAFSQHAGSGGNIIALDNVKSNALSCIISNTDKKLTFQRRGNALRLERIFAKCTELGIPIVEQPSPAGTGSYLQVSYANIDKAKVLVDYAITLL